MQAYCYDLLFSPYRIHNSMFQQFWGVILINYRFEVLTWQLKHNCYFKAWFYLWKWRRRYRLWYNKTFSEHYYIMTLLTRKSSLKYLRLGNSNYTEFRKQVTYTYFNFLDISISTANTFRSTWINGDSRYASKIKILSNRLTCCSI